MSAALALVVSVFAGQQVPGPVALHPAELVAQQVRSVLYAEDGQAALKRLAGALPILAVSGEADVQATFAAARLAEELSNGSGVIEESPAGSLSFGMALLRAINVELLGTLLALVSVSLALWWASGPDRHRLADFSARRDRVKSRVTPYFDALLMRAGNKRRIDRALTLASSGIPLGEVARQTGISRDALSVLLGMSR